MPAAAIRYPATALRGFAARLLERAGLASDRAADVADILVEGDLMGHTTHGLQLLGPYLKALEDGGLTRTGDPAVVADRGGTIAWDGNFLPGPWLVLRAMGRVPASPSRASSPWRSAARITSPASRPTCRARPRAGSSCCS
jgi:LDH2 family malate/lactate/ureidoglycolate dehydrogenase